LTGKPREIREKKKLAKGIWVFSWWGVDFEKARFGDRRVTGRKVAWYALGI